MVTAIRLLASLCSDFKTLLFWLKCWEDFLLFAAAALRHREAADWVERRDLPAALGRWFGHWEQLFFRAGYVEFSLRNTIKDGA
jgi:hypothetical protein